MRCRCIGSEVREKVVKSVHYVPKTGQQMERQYSDYTSLSGRKTTSVYPKEDENKNSSITEFGLSTYNDYQQVTLQEMPERAPAGQMPNSVDVILLKELVGEIKVCPFLHLACLSAVFAVLTMWIPPAAGGSGQDHGDLPDIPEQEPGLHQRDVQDGADRQPRHAAVQGRSGDGADERGHPTHQGL